MSWKEIEKELRGRFESSLTEWEWPNDLRIRVRLDAAALVEVVQFLTHSKSTRFITATALESRGGHLEIWYHFDFFQTPQTLSIVVAVPHGRPRLPSVTPYVKSAEWIEREITEMYGVQFDGLPRPGRLLLPEGWPKSVHPMRKD